MDYSNAIKTLNMKHLNMVVAVTDFILDMN
jgi:hypothetical protein